NLVWGTQCRGREPTEKHAMLAWNAHLGQTRTRNCEALRNAGNGRNVQRRTVLLVLAAGSLELPHECNEGVDTGLWERVVDRSSHTTDGPVALEAVEARRRRFGDETLFEIFSRQPEGNVHHRPAFSLRGSPVEAGAVDLAVQLRRLLSVERGNRRQAPL